MASKVADIARIQQRTLHERAAPKLNSTSVFSDVQRARNASTCEGKHGETVQRFFFGRNPKELTWSFLCERQRNIMTF